MRLILTTVSTRVREVECARYTLDAKPDAEEATTAIVKAAECLYRLFEQDGGGVGEV